MEIRRVEQFWWDIFSHYHYLTDKIPNNGKVYVGFINNEPVGCVVMSRFPHPINKKLVKVSRIVVLPHWQGYGLGLKMVETIGRTEEYNHMDVRATTTLPIVHNYMWKNHEDWVLRYQGIDKKGTAGRNAQFAHDVREVYMETYRLYNECPSKDAIARKNIEPHMKRNYEPRHLQKRKEMQEYYNLK